MNRKAEIVIGGAFGDEGKGLITDYLAAKAGASSFVVRFNGGAQAGHTVTLEDGRRHVFGHVGSGALAGAPTFLSAYYVCNPIVFLREMEKLQAFHATPRIYADPACLLTTPYDMMINQIIETMRGDKRHGSCGIGFGETLERNLHTIYSLHVREAKDKSALMLKLGLIRDEWVPPRLAALGLGDIPEIWQQRLADAHIIERYLEDVAKFLDQVALAPLAMLKDANHIIFEGAQGLLLDQERGWFPYVTRSNTGIRNALVLAAQLGLTALDAYYVTRSYTTRHGAGPLPHEVPEKPYAKIVDATNIPNPYQGSLRFAWLDLDLFAENVRKDLKDAQGRMQVTPHLAMSCLDQIEGDARFFMRGKKRKMSKEALVEQARAAIGAQTALASYGPARGNVQKYQPAIQHTVQHHVPRSYPAMAGGV